VPLNFPFFFLAESGVKDAAEGVVLQVGAAGNGEEVSVSEVRERTEASALGPLISLVS
jgi:hypothetical protein